MRSILVDVGQQFGEWTVLESDVPYKGSLGLRVKCACGREETRGKHQILRGKSTSCGHPGSRTGLPGPPRIPVEVGEQLGNWTVLEVDVPYSTAKLGLRVKCACGREAIREKRSIVEGLSMSCGRCANSPRHAGASKSEVSVGDKFGRWTVTGTADSGKGGMQRVEVRCSCDKQTEAVRYLASLRKGLVNGKGGSTSCGCYRGEALAERSFKHGLSRAGNRHPLYAVWYGMMQRCHNENDSRYPEYGGSGIRVWKPWHDPARFVQDVEKEIGPRPEITRSHEWSIDRLNNLLGYQPGNIAWSTPDQQSRNRRNVMRRTLACECGVGVRVVGQVSWWECLACGQEHVVLREDQRRRSR
jgi:hypothetical protein